MVASTALPLLRWLLRDASWQICKIDNNMLLCVCVLSHIVAMKVLWIDSVSQLGGAQWSLAEVCGKLKEQGVEVVAAVPEGPLAAVLHSRGVEVHHVSQLRARRKGFRIFSTIAGLLQSSSGIRRIVHEVNPDIIHANSLTALLSIGAVRRDLPLFWHVRDIRLPYVAAREGMRRAERIIVISEAVDQELLGMLPENKRGRMRLIRNGIDLDRYQAGDSAEARQALGLPEGVPVIGMIAHLVPWKRHDAFIAMAAIVAKRYPEAHFVAVGRDLFGEHKRLCNELREQVAAAGVQERFHWIKDCDHSGRVLPAFNVLVHPARNEPFGRVICEALLCGIPVVAAESGGPSTLITHEINGLLVPGGEAEELAEAAVYLLENPAEAARMAEAGRAEVVENYSSARVAEQLVREYRATLLAVRGYKDSEE